MRGDILQWNCNGLRPKWNELKLWLAKKKFDVLALQEANLPVGMNLVLFKRYTAPHPIQTFKHGSLALFVGVHLPQHQLKTGHLCSEGTEVIAVRTRLGTAEVTLVTVYCRPSNTKTKLPPDFLRAVTNSLPEPFIICGDFNAHHALWGDQNTDNRGRDLATDFEEANLVMANSGEPTFYRHPYQSAIDLCFHSRTVLLNWDVMLDTRGSDHFPILITVQCKASPTKKRTKIVNWDKFRSLIEKTEGDVLEAVSTSLKAATRMVMTPSKEPKPDLKYLRLCAARQRAQRRLRRHKDPASLTEYRKITAVLRRYSATLRRSQWKKFSASLNEHSPVGRVWGVARSMMNIESHRNTFASLALAKRMTEEELAEGFANIFAAGRLSVIPAPPLVCDSGTSANKLDSDFTMHELAYAVRRLKPRGAPGSDGITNQALRNLPDSALQKLVQYINQVWSTSCVPAWWKESIMVPIPKPGKPLSELTSYRPISLTSCVAKLAERLVHRRISWLLETKHLLPDTMTGFRKHLSATDTILDLVSDSDEAAQRGTRTAAVFFDVKQAFDSVPVQSVLDALSAAGIEGRTKGLIYELLTNRTYRVRLGKAVSSIRKQNVGLPQGSVLSPLLFNLVMAKLPAALPTSLPRINVSLYADDICLWTASKSHATLRRTLQAGIDAVSQYVTGKGLQLSTEKTTFMLIGSGGRRGRFPQLTLNNVPLKRVRVTKFLGATIDSRMSWVPYTTTIKLRCQATLNLTRRLAHPASGCPQSTLRIIHSALTVGQLMFVYPYAKLSESSRTALERIHLRGLKNTIGVPLFTKNVATYAESTALPLPLLATKQLLLQVTRLQKTRSGRALLSRLRRRPHSRFTATLRTHKLLGPNKPQPAPKPAPWLVHEPRCNISIPGIKRKVNTSDSVAQALVEDCLQESHRGALRIFTDASVDRGAGTSAAAFCIPSLNVEWAEAMHGTPSSRDAELLAIQSALTVVQMIDREPGPVVIISDSRAALQTITNCYEEHPVALRILRIVKELHRKGTSVALQWVPSHKGVRGNERADTLAKQATKRPPALYPPPSEAVVRSAITEHIWRFHPDARTAQKTAPPTCITRGFTRDETSLLMRLRSGSAKTKAVLHFIGQSKDPFCTSCDVHETIEHVVQHCKKFKQPRKRMIAKMKAVGYPSPLLETILYPTGTASTRRKIQRALLDFIKESGLAGVL